MADAKKGGGGRKARCFCIPPTIFSTYPIMSAVNTDQSKVGGISAWSELNYFALMPEIVKSRRFFQMISSIIERHKTSFKDVLCNTVLSPSKNTPNIDYNENNDQFRVNTQNLCSYLIKHNGYNGTD